MGPVALWQGSPGRGKPGPVVCSTQTLQSLPAELAWPKIPRPALAQEFPDPLRPVSLHCWDSLADVTARWSSPFKKPQIRIFFRAFTSAIHSVETLGRLCPCSHHQVLSGCVSGILISALLQLSQQDKEVCRHLLWRAGNYMLVKAIYAPEGRQSLSSY